LNSARQVVISPPEAPCREGIANQFPQIGQLAVATMVISWLPDSQVETSRLVRATLLRNPQLFLSCLAAAFPVATSVALWEFPLENLKYRAEEPLEVVAVFARPAPKSVASSDWAGLRAQELRPRSARAALWGPAGRHVESSHDSSNADRQLVGSPYLPLLEKRLHKPGTPAVTRPASAQQVWVPRS